MKISWEYLDKKYATVNALKDYANMRRIVQHPVTANDTTPASIRECHCRAHEYMAWFLPAWNALSSADQSILELFFFRDNASKTERLYDVCETLFVERAQAYRRRDKAVARLALLLYGR